MISLHAGSRIWRVAGITEMRNGFCSGQVILATVLQ